MITTRRSYPHARWARRDLRWVSAYLLLLVFAVPVRELLYVAAAIPVGLASFVGVRAMVRRRRWRRDGPPEFWADKIR